MRNFTLLKRLSVLPLAAVLTFASCESKQTESSCKVTSTDIDLSSNPARITAPSTGKTYTLQVSGDATWVAKSNNNEMVALSKTDIQHSPGELLVTILPNTAFAGRSAVVTITSPALYQPITLNISQPQAGAPIINKVLQGDKDPLNITSQGDTLRYTITAEPSTPLTFEIDPASQTWISTVDGKLTEWAFSANIKDAPRSGWVCVKYNNGQSAADTIHFTQKASEIIVTPQITADPHAYFVTLTWPTTQEVIDVYKEMCIQIEGGPLAKVPIEDGSLRINMAPNTTSGVVYYAITKNNAESEIEDLFFTSKKVTDTYMFKDGKMKENLATWLSAKRSPIGKPMNVSVYLHNGGITYDTLAMVTDLKLTYQFGQSSSGMVDLLQCKNLENIQLGRGYYDDGIGFGNVPSYQEKLGKVLTKANFPSLVKLGIWKDATTISAAVKTATQAVCTANGLTYATDMNLLWPNEVIYTPNTIQSQSATIADMQLLDRSNWKSVSWSTSEPVGEGASGRMGSLFDSNFLSYWHSQWSGVTVPVTLPHAFVIDLGASTTFNSVVMANRVNGNADSRALAYTIEFSNDVPTSWGNADDVSAPEPAGFNWSTPIKVVNNVTPASTETSVNTNVFKMANSVTARCIRVKITAIETFPTNNSCAISEFGVSNR